MNRTIKDATVRRFYYETHNNLRAHLATFLNAYNFAKHLKSLRGLTPLSVFASSGHSSHNVRLNPLHHMAGLNIWTPWHCPACGEGVADTAQRGA
jgi:hypothetical protein